MPGRGRATSTFMYQNYGPPSTTVLNEFSVMWRPLNWIPDNTRYGVIYCHGAGENAQALMNPTGIIPHANMLFHRIAENNRVLYAGDLGTYVPGTTFYYHWGHPHSQLGIDLIRQRLELMGCKPGKVHLVAVSMGGLAMFNYARNYPGKVATMTGIIPACSLAYLRDNNIIGSKASIESAWGITSAQPLPVGADPGVYNTGLSSIPSRLYYAPDDPITTAATITALGTTIGSELISVGNTGHSDVSVGAVDPDDLEAWWSQND